MNTQFIKKTTPLLAVGALLLGSCQPDIDAPKVDKGSADFSNYVAVGNSLTSGYQSGGLANYGIETSYPAILAQQFAKAGGGTFIQPLFDAAYADGSGYAKFFGFLPNTDPPAPDIRQPSAANNFLDEKVAYTNNRLPLPAPPAVAAQELRPYTGPLPNNLGVPGISVLSADKTASSNPTVAGLAAAYGSLNNFYHRLLPAADRGSKDYVTYIGQQNPTFFTCWMGNNDVLTYATQGGVQGTNPFGGLTDTTSFGRGYRNIVRTISKNGTVKGVVANIPNVTNVPYFNTVTLDALLAAFKKINPAITSVYIQVGSGTTATTRAATSGDLFTLTASAAAATGAGTSPTNPLPSQFVLDATELASVVTRTNQLNGIIAKTARQYKVPVADMNLFFGSIAMNGIATNGVANNASFIRGNLFSLDGVHPTSRGYAVIANEFIRVINTTYGAAIPQVNPNEYQAILLP